MIDVSLVDDSARDDPGNDVIKVIDTNEDDIEARENNIAIDPLQVDLTDATDEAVDLDDDEEDIDKLPLKDKKQLVSVILDNDTDEVFDLGQKKSRFDRTKSLPTLRSSKNKNKLLFLKKIIFYLHLDDHQYMQAMEENNVVTSLLSPVNKKTILEARKKKRKVAFNDNLFITVYNQEIKPSAVASGMSSIIAIEK